MRASQPTGGRVNVGLAGWTTRDFVSRTAKNLTVGCQDDAIVRQPGHVSGPVRRGHVAVERVVCGRRRERGDAISQCGELDAEVRVKKFGGEKWCAGDDDAP